MNDQTSDQQQKDRVAETTPQQQQQQQQHQHQHQQQPLLLALSFSSHHSNTTLPEKRTLTTVLYCLAASLLFADQSLLAPNLSSIADEFGFSDEERDVKLGGQMSLAFFLVGIPSSFLCGMFADRYPGRRSQIFSAVVFLGEGACLLTYFTTSYVGLFVTRTLTGLSFGGGFPIIFSMLGDLFAHHERYKVIAAINAVSLAGAGLGQLTAAFLGPVLGWRVPFLVVSIPAMIVSLMVLFVAKDPESGGMESVVLEHRHRVASSTSLVTHPAHHENQDKFCNLSRDNDNIPSSSQQKEERCRAPRCSRFKQLLKTPSVLLILLQSVFFCIPWGIITIYLNDYLAKDIGLTVETSALLLSLFAIGFIFGSLLYALLGTFWIGLSSKRTLIVGGLGTCLICVPFFFLLNTTSSPSSLPRTTSSLFFSGFFCSISSIVVRYTLINVTVPSSRGLAFAILSLFLDVGRGLGPFLISRLIELVNDDRKKAFSIGMTGWLISGMIIASISIVVDKDEESMQKRVAFVEGNSSHDDCCIQLEVSLCHEENEDKNEHSLVMPLLLT